MQLTTNVYVQTGYRGANVGYVTADHGVVMVDSPMKPTDAVAWRREVEAKGWVRYLINTEPHIDHCFGNFFFDAPVIAHHETREAVLAADQGQVLEHIAKIDPEGVSLITEYHANVPSITFSERLTLYLDSHSFHLLHLPGHTPSQTAVFVPEEKVVFTGDNVFFKVQAFLDEADPFAWLKSLDRISELEADYIVPGHGEICDKSYLVEQADFIREWIDLVKRAVDHGWSKEEAMARISLLNRYPMSIGLESMGPEVQRKNVSHLYGLLSNW